MPERLVDREESRRLAQLLAKARRSAGIDQTRAAEVLGISQAAISKLENGLRSIEVFEFVELCELYGVDPCETLRQATSD
jgi:transcriptional regulator with XRE-family HTH domain